MELDVRDWLIIVGVLLIAVVLLDGVRRVRNERRGRIRMSLNKQFMNSSDPILEPHLSELPGGARVIDRSALDLEQSVPMLMDSVAAASLEDLLDEKDLMDEEDLRDEQDLPVYQDHRDTLNARDAQMGDLFADLPPLSRGSSAAGSKTAAATQPVSGAASEPRKKVTRRHSGPAQVVVIHVYAPEGKVFQGPDLLHILLACDLRFGKMNIFHRYEKSNGGGEIQFSVANAVEPGTFDLDGIHHFTTPGVSFFLSMPGPELPLRAYNYMLETARVLEKNLGGELRDDARQQLSAQAIELTRQRIGEYERNQLPLHA